MITIEELHQQCRVDHDDEDDLLLGYAAAARENIQMYLDRTIYDGAVPSDDPCGVLFNKSIRQAILLLVGQWYAHREATSNLTLNQVPFGFYHLLQPYRNMGI